ncbi:MAG: TonB-dependent receptor [Chitinophagales bacterium]|nr:TonB-dependent receptor [Chitinophagales bacterium]
MKRNALLLALLCITICSYCQQDTLKELEEAVVYSNKFVEKKKNLFQKIDVISSKTISNYNTQNSGDLLIASGNVFVQKSQQGGSSPAIRGFEASRVLLVVDGIRMNNAIYRAGHLQNAITVDQNMLERVEILYGPTSTMYGSDGLGGVIHFRTKSPVLSSNEKIKTTGNGFIRYSSANDEKTGHADLSIGGQKLAWLQSYTYSDFGDMKMGDNYPAKYPDFGRRSMYIDKINGIDSVVTSKDDRIQYYSGYRQWDIAQKLLFKPNDKIVHSLNLQHSNSSNIPRYDRLQDVKDFGGSIGTTLRYADWFYGPQTRWLAAYELHVMHPGWFNELRLNINYQDVKESRQQREYRRYDRFDSRREHVKVAGFILDARKVWNNNELNMGVDGQLNDVNSVADRTNLQTGVKTKIDTRYPDGKNNMNYFGAYAQHLLKMADGKWVLNDGIRFQFVNLHSTIIDNSFFNLPVTNIKQNPFAVTGNIGIVYLPNNQFRFTAGIASGFRAPNVDDLSRVFESSTADKRVVIPNADIKPEYTYSFDAGIIWKKDNLLRFEITGFYTLFRNAIALAPYRLNGQDSINYNGTIAAVYANQNVNKAFVTGVNARVLIEFNKMLSWDNTISQTYGRYIRSDNTKIPLDHVPPVFGKSSLNFNSKKFNADFYCMFNGWKKIKDYNPDGEDNGKYATPDGMPSWLTLNLKAGYRITDIITVQFGIENITDRNYRYFASGFSAPGRNFIMALRAAF